MSGDEAPGCLTLTRRCPYVTPAPEGIQKPTVLDHVLVRNQVRIEQATRESDIHPLFEPLDNPDLPSDG